MMELEAEVEEILRRLERERGFEILSQPSLEGASGMIRRVDFVIKYFNNVKYLVECKDVRSRNLSTFHTQMCRAYTELCDLLLKLNRGWLEFLVIPRVRGIVVVRDFPYIGQDLDRWEIEFEKWENLFHPISTQFYTLDMFRDLGLDDIKEEIKEECERRFFNREEDEVGGE